jgi:hypothetical protein
LDTHTSLTACEGIKPDVVQMSTWSTSRLPVIDIPPSENVPLCVKTKQTILSTPNDSYIKTGEPAKVNLCSPTKDECLSHETRKLVGDMKTPPLCESLKQLEADCSVVEHDKSIEPSSSGNLFFLIMIKYQNHSFFIINQYLGKENAKMS